MRPRASAVSETRWEVSGGQRRRGRVGRARLAGRSLASCHAAAPPLRRARQRRAVFAIADAW
eukprot:8386020-Pyramimonas_sp.AAC.1